MQNIFNVVNGVLGMATGGLQGAAMQGMRFSKDYRCFPVAMCEKENLHSLEEGDKVVLPTSALHVLSRLHVAYPMVFEIQNANDPSKKSHCGVMEFSAREGSCYMPHWMMNNLGLAVGDTIRVTNVSLARGTYVQLQPHRTDFINLSNPKAVLEKALRHFTCLSKGDTIVIHHGPLETFKLDVAEVKPGSAVMIVEADVNLEFLPPKDHDEFQAGYSRPEPQYEGKVDADAPISWANNDHQTTDVIARESQAEEVPKDDSTSSPYFARLGKGHKLSSSPSPTRPSSIHGQEPQSTTQPSFTSGSLSSTSGSSPGSTSHDDDGVKRVVEDSGKFRYIYEVDPKTNRKRLVRRVPIPKQSYFSGQGHSLKKNKKRS